MHEIKIKEYPERINGMARFGSIEESFSWWMKSRRKTFNRTQDQLAKVIPMARATYSAYENGTSSPKLRDFIRICDALYLDPMQIIEDSCSDL